MAAAAAVAALRTRCATNGCGRTFPSNGHSHCCSACRHTMSQHHTRRCDSHQTGTDARGRVTVCSIPGCTHLAGLGHITCCSRCVGTQGRRHTRRCYNANFGHPAVAIFLGAQGRWDDRTAATMTTTSCSSPPTAAASSALGSASATNSDAPGTLTPHNLDHGVASAELTMTHGETATTDAADEAAAEIGVATTSDSASSTFCEDVKSRTAVTICLDSLD